MIALRIGLGVPRGVGDPSTPFAQVDHRDMLRYAQLAERLGFDSVWVPDHFYYEWPPGRFEPFPDPWTLMTAIGATTDRVQIGSMVLAPAFRHPAVLARMAGALQQLTGGRLVLGVGAGNQRSEHHAFGFPFDGRVRRLAEYLAILSGLLANERVTLNGRFYSLNDASLRMSVPPVPIWVAGSGPRMLDLTATYARGWDAGNAVADGATAFRASFATLRKACEARRRDPDQIEVSCSTNVLVLPDARATRGLIDTITASTGWSPATVRERFVIGTPDEVVRRLTRAVEWGVTNFVCSLGGRHSGIVTAMTGAVMDELHAAGCDLAYLCAEIKDPGIVRLYGQADFVTLGRPHTFLGRSGRCYTDTEAVIAPVRSQALFDAILRDSQPFDIGVGNW